MTGPLAGSARAMGPITELTSRYRLDSLIAAGGMGEVWRADDPLLDRRVAVKLLRPEYVHDPVIMARFRAEAHYVGQLSHPGITQVYDYAEATPASPAYLVMELVDGPSLAALLAAGPLPPRRTADVLAQAAEALHAAHRSGVVHRDVKPGNLLMAPDGRVKMTDFGIAYSPQAASLTSTGALLGTMAYLAPERASGRSATPASDLYGLGVVGYECLAGRPPFQGEPLQVALAHRDQPFPALPGWCLDDPAGAALAELILEMTAKDPRARPGSAAEVAARAGQIRDGVRPAVRVSQESPDGALAMSPDGALAMSPDGALAMSPDGALAMAPAPGMLAGPGRPAHRPRRRFLLAGLLALAFLVAGVVAWQFTALRTPRSAAALAAPTASGPALRPAVARPVRVTDALVGQPISVARQRLHAHGLRVLVRVQADPDAAPGTVLRVSPTGRLFTGHLVLLTVAVRPPAAASSTPSSHARPGPASRPSPTSTPSAGSTPSPGSTPPGRAKHSKGPPPGQDGNIQDGNIQGSTD